MGPKLNLPFNYMPLLVSCILIMLNDDCIRNGQEKVDEDDIFPTGSQWQLAFTIYMYDKTQCLIIG